MKVTIKDLRSGAEKSIPRAHARVLVAIGRAEYVEPVAAAPAAGAEVAAKPRARRPYKRRDLTAEPAGGLSSKVEGEGGGMNSLWPLE